MADRLNIGPLAGGGLVLSWRCSSRCRHCLYGSGPWRTDGRPASDADLDRLLDDLHARAPHAAWHIGGGEPFLDPDLLEKTIDGMVRRGMFLQYVETNASWVTDPGQTEALLRRLAGVGLRCLLISVSPFHAEFVPLARTRLLIQAARRFLPHAPLVWIPDFLTDLEGIDADHPLPFDTFLAGHGRDYGVGLTERYGLVAAGRTGRFLAAQGATFPTDELLRQAPCRRRLADTSHFHVDAEGNYVPGLCAGLRWPWSSLPGPIDLAGFPLLQHLADGDLAGLWKKAVLAGFEGLPAYASPCDLCTHVRQFFYARDPAACPELGPAGFYDPRSLPAYLD